MEDIIQTLTTKYENSTDHIKLFQELAELIEVEYCIPPKRIKTQPDIILANDDIWINIYLATNRKDYGEQTFAYEIYTIHPPAYQGGANIGQGRPFGHCIGSIMCQLGKYKLKR